VSTAAVVETVVERPSSSTLVVVTPKAPRTSERFFDQHPLVPVFVAGFFALALSGAMVASTLLWLALRHSGVMAP
jgi:hypothetical protein